jgi:hypothetical protein
MGLSAGLLMKWLSLEGIDISSLDLSPVVKVRIISQEGFACRFVKVIIISPEHRYFLTGFVSLCKSKDNLPYIGLSAGL